MNRYRKTGTYIRPDNALIESGLYNEIAPTSGAGTALVPAINEYGDEYE